MFDTQELKDLRAAMTYYLAHAIPATSPAYARCQSTLAKIPAEHAPVSAASAWWVRD